MNPSKWWWWCLELDAFIQVCSKVLQSVNVVVQHISCSSLNNDNSLIFNRVWNFWLHHFRGYVNLVWPIDTRFYLSMVQICRWIMYFNVFIYIQSCLLSFFLRKRSCLHIATYFQDAGKGNLPYMHMTAATRECYSGTNGFVDVIDVLS